MCNHSGGCSSRLCLVEDKSNKNANPIKQFLVRLYGGKMFENDDILVTSCGGEVKETLAFYAIGVAGLGPKMYGAFNGGRVEQFLPSHTLRETDYNERPEITLELARNVARFHALELPISQIKYDLLRIAEQYHNECDKEALKSFGEHFGISTKTAEEFDIASEIKWAKCVEKVIGSRIVTCKGDLVKHNILVLDELNKFGERIMIIDYERTAREYRGRDIGELFAMRQYEMINGIFTLVSEYPKEEWRRNFIQEYLNETKGLGYFEWDEVLDSIEHVLMEAEFFGLYILLLYAGSIIRMKTDTTMRQQPIEAAKQWIVSIRDSYSCIIENYRKVFFS